MPIRTLNTVLRAEETVLEAAVVVVCSVLVLM
jgi:hypothetical protein